MHTWTAQQLCHYYLISQGCVWARKFSNSHSDLNLSTRPLLKRGRESTKRRRTDVKRSFTSQNLKTLKSSEEPHIAWLPQQSSGATNAAASLRTRSNHERTVDSAISGLASNRFCYWRFLSRATVISWISSNFSKTVFHSV